MSSLSVQVSSAKGANSGAARYHPRVSTDLEHRLSALEAADERKDTTLNEILQRLQQYEDTSGRAWQAIESHAEEHARLAVRVDKLEGAFESQWSVLRRLEVGALDTRRDMQAGFREVRDEVRDIREEVREGLAAIGSRIEARPPEGAPS